jgi:hypothetical protein
MPRTQTALPTNRSMWCKLLRRCHPCCPPDAGGDADLFVWVRELQGHVAGDAIEAPRREYVPPRRTTTDDFSRMPFEEAFGSPRPSTP